MPHFNNGTLKVQVDSTVNMDWKDPKPVNTDHCPVKNAYRSKRLIKGWKETKTLGRLFLTSPKRVVTVTLSIIWIFTLHSL